MKTTTTTKNNNSNQAELNYYPILFGRAKLRGIHN